MATYTQIADNDPGGSLQAAFDDMSTRKTATDAEKRLTDLDIARELGFSQGNDILDGLQAAVDAGALPSRVMRWIENVGLDINHSDTVATISSLVGAGFLTQSDADALIALGRTFEFPGLTISQLDKARRLRLEGKA